MRVTDFIIRQLGAHLMSASIGYRAEQLPQGIVLLEADMPLKKDRCYITDKATWEAWLAGGREAEPCYVFFTEGTGNVNTLSIPEVLTAYETDLAIAPLYNHLRRTLLRMVQDDDKLTEDGGTFGDFLHSVITAEITRYDDIHRRLKMYSHYNSDKYRVIVFQFANPAAVAEQKETVFAAVRSVFPYSNTALYFDHAVAVVQGQISLDGTVLVPPEKLEALQKICERLDARCGISNETKNAAVLRASYLHAEKTVDIGNVMCPDRKQRVFTQEEYSAYLMMDMAYREFVRYFGLSNYLYMVHPSMSEILRYDEEHNSDYREVLYRYLQCDRNLSKTAEAMFMHRNTVIYKVNKVLELVGDDFEDPKIRMRLLWSCMMCEYCEKKLGIKPKPYPR